ncbi:MAG: GNAT family N-acetyltransferase [Acidimicrobiia bacterium]
MADSADLVHRGHHALALAFQEISRRSDTGNVLVDDDVAVYATGHPEAEFYNGVLRLNADSDPEQLIRRADAYFTSRSNGYTVWALLGRDEDLAVAAMASGLEPGAEMPEMICKQVPTQTSTPANIELTIASSDIALRDSNTVMAEAFATIGVPPDAWNSVWPNIQSIADRQTRTVIAYEAGVPVAGAMVIVVGGVGEVLNVGTIPSARRRGLGRLVTHRVTSLAFDLGADFASLQSTPFGISVYESLGYEAVGYYRWYLRRWPPS